MKWIERKPASNAERQSAHRQRVKDRLAGLPPPQAPLKKLLPKPSRPKQLEQATQLLQGLADGYDAWLGALPANLAESTTAERLQETIDHLQTALEAIEAIDPPRVGR